MHYIENVTSETTEQNLYVIMGPAFDYDADGLPDADLNMSACVTSFVNRLVLFLLGYC